MLIDVLGGTGAQQYVDWSNQRTINWYPVLSDQEKGEKNKTQIALFPRPGLDVHVDLSGNLVRGLYTAKTLTQERCFAVVGNTLYEIYRDGSSTSRGTMPNLSNPSQQKVYMEVNGNGQMMIQDSNAGYYFTLSTNVLAEITDADYLGGNILTYLDGYLVISGNDGRVAFSELNDASNWIGDSVFTPTFKADAVKAVMAYREEIYCFGSETIEVYLNDGATPFIRQGKTTLYYGIKAPHSLAAWHGGFAFLGSSRFGETAVYTITSDYNIKAISTPSIVQQVNDANDLENVEGYIEYSKDGHIFYVMHVPVLHTTFVYDYTINMWHERQSVRTYSDADGDFPQDMFRGRCFTSFAGMNLYGDWYSGKILRENKKTYTDGGNIITRTRISPVFNNELKYISVYELEVDANVGQAAATSGQGSDPVIMLDWSLDGGNTFEEERLMLLGQLGQYDYRAQTTKLGTARNWVIRLKNTEPIDLALFQVRARGTFSSW